MDAQGAAGDRAAPAQPLRAPRKPGVMRDLELPDSEHRAELDHFGPQKEIMLPGTRVLEYEYVSVLDPARTMHMQYE